MENDKTSDFSTFYETVNFKDETSGTLLLGKATMGRPDHVRRVGETGVYLIYESTITGVSLDENDWSISADKISGVSTK